MRAINQKLVVVGVSFKKASLDIRNKFALTTDHTIHLYDYAESKKVADYFILSTCNRTEIYSTGADTSVLLSLLAANSSASEEDVAQYTFTKSGEEAVEHLFRVACGLDSQILGDYEIIGQIKKAFALCKSHGKASGLMEKLVNLAIQVSKEVKCSTSLSDGTTSVSYAIIQLLKEKFAQAGSMRICLLGLGKIGTLTLKNLTHYLPQHKIIVLNRSAEKAEMAAGEYKVDYAPFESQKEVLQQADVLIVATGADHILIDKGDISAGGVKIIFDLSMPSNVSPKVRELERVQFYNIDDLSKIVNEVIDTRKLQVPMAETVVRSFMDEFEQWKTRRAHYTLVSKESRANAMMAA